MDTPWNHRCGEGEPVTVTYEFPAFAAAVWANVQYLPDVPPVGRDEARRMHPCSPGLTLIEGGGESDPCVEGLPRPELRIVR